MYMYLTPLNFVPWPNRAETNKVCKMALHFKIFH